MQEHLEDIKEIRSIMERSSRFMSLSGFSGILIGLYTIGYVVLLKVYYGIQVFDLVPYSLLDLHAQAMVLWAFVLLGLSMITSIALTVSKTRSQSQQIWTSTTKRLMQALAVPLIAGGAVVCSQLYQYEFELFFPLSQVFYGLAIFAASRYTFDELRYMGLINLGLGILALLFPAQALLFWSIGFGLLHLVYGYFMSQK